MPTYCFTGEEIINAALESEASESTEQDNSNSTSSRDGSSTSDSSWTPASTDNTIPSRRIFPASRNHHHVLSSTSRRHVDPNPSQPALQTNSCTDPACNDPNCDVTVTQQNSSRPPSTSGCTDANCTSCDHKATNNARNVMIGITGFLIILMIGYMAYIKKKPSVARSKQNVFLGDAEERGNFVPPVFAEKSGLKTLLIQ